jgi:hypothetical protein
MTNATKGKLIRYAATALCVGVPFAATLTQFPIWIYKSSEATVSGTFLLFAMLSALPFIKQIIAYFKSPAVWVVWCVLLVSLILLRNIIDEMIIVCMAGAPANIVGMFIYKIGKHIEDKDKTDKE